MNTHPEFDHADQSQLLRTQADPRRPDALDWAILATAALLTLVAWLS